MSNKRHGRGRSLAVSAWSLRRKVALAIAIPLLLAATLGGLQVRGDLTESANSSSSAKQVTVLRPAVDYLTAAERAMVASQDPSPPSQSDLKTAVRDLRGAATELQTASDAADLTQEQRNQVDVVLDLSRAIRETDDTLSPDTWLAQLRQLQSGVTQLITTIVNAQLDPEPRLEQLAQTLGGRFSLSMQQALVATDRTGDTGSLELFAELGAEGAAIDRLASAAGDAEPAIAALRTENGQRSRTVRTGGDDLGGADAYTEYDGLITRLLDGIDDQLAASATSARQSALVNGGITAAALLAAILLALLVSRLLLRPLRKVREGALNVAHEQLPEAVARIRAGESPGQIVPIDVTTNEEVGQLARAVDDMHRQAVLLASGEASLRSQVSEMFVTLSRRNTTLINQQLGLIEKLERDEEDPRRLESLFRLDHLASRMRRTADSLLILADAPTTSAGASDVLTVAASLQAATAGVQDYQRVRVGAAGTSRINDDAAADVVHLLTELVDNALTYSAPKTTVTLSSTAAVGGVTIEIADAGLGIPERALADINETLRSGGDVTPLTARRMGLFVVSRLAQRHGITASLVRNQQNGTTAAVFLPSSVLNAFQVDQGASSPVVNEVAQVDDVTPDRPDRGNLAARISAARGLPTRRPGASPEIAARQLVAPETVAPRITEWPTPTPDPAVAFAVVVPQFANDPLSDALPEQPAGGVEFDTPIFRAVRSAWLNTNGGEEPWRSSEIEAGWDRADTVAVRATDMPVNASGLPVRRPGTRLVPGGVTKPKKSAARDPEAIRARLAAHAAGVSRGRTAAATSHDKQPTEAGPG